MSDYNHDYYAQLYDEEDIGDQTDDDLDDLADSSLGIKSTRTDGAWHDECACW